MNNEKGFTKTPKQILISKDGVYVDDTFLDNKVIEDIANSMMDFNNKQNELTEVKPTNREPSIMFEPAPIDIIDVDCEYIAPITMDLNGKVSKNVPISHVATKDEIEVVPNGIIFDEILIPLDYLGDAARIGMGMCRTMSMHNAVNEYKKLNQG